MVRGRTLRGSAASILVAVVFGRGRLGRRCGLVGLFPRLDGRVRRGRGRLRTWRCGARRRLCCHLAF